MPRDGRSVHCQRRRKLAVKLPAAHIFQRQSAEARRQLEQAGQRLKIRLEIHQLVGTHTGFAQPNRQSIVKITHRREDVVREIARRLEFFGMADSAATCWPAKISRYLRSACTASGNIPSAANRS